MEQERLRTIQGLQSAQAADERTKRGLIDSIVHPLSSHSLPRRY